MSIFTKYRDIIEADIDAMLTHAVNPRGKLRLMIQDIENTLVEMKVQCAQTMADKAQATRTCERITEEVDRWTERAQMALEKGREDMAREALVRRKSVQADIARMTDEILETAEQIRLYQNEIAQVESKLIQARDKLRKMEEAPAARPKGNDGYSIIPPPASQQAAKDPEIEKELERMRKNLSKDNL